MARRFGVLGTLLVDLSGRPRPITAGQARVVLATLLLNANHPVTAEQLIEYVWEDPPKSARTILYTTVLRLRRAFEHHDLIRTSDGGYLMEVGPGELDLDRFHALLEQAGDAGTRSDAITERAHLAAAIKLWRGPALSDVPSPALQQSAAEDLEEQRLQALIRRIDLDVRLGHHAEVVTELRRLTRRYPLRESFTAQLMTALHRSGRGAEALDAYHDLRRILVRELGTEPSKDLRELHQAILTAEPSSVPGPAAPTLAEPPGRSLNAEAGRCQLPPDVTDLVGRDAAVDHLETTLTAGGAVPRLVVVPGPPGVGKTALAVRVAHRVRSRFPDGQWFVRLRGTGPSPRDTGEVLAELLGALDVDGRSVPARVDARAALLRTHLADRRVLLVLDDARDAAQVRPLLPGTGGSAVLVTTRQDLRGLVALQGAHRYPLGMLAASDARELLARILGEETLRAEPAAAGELLALCGGLPLALRLAAVGLAGRPEPVLERFVAALRGGNPLAILGVAGDPCASLETAFDRSYALLDQATRRLFRLLGLLPCQRLSAETVAALLETPVAEAERLLDGLVAASLVEHRPRHRFQLHELLRLYAAERARRDEPAAEREAALDRCYAFVAATADNARRLLYPGMVRLPSPAPIGSGRGFAHAEEARAWLDDERANLVAIAHHASRTGRRRTVWDLTDALRGHLRYHSRRDLSDWRVVTEAGLRAAQEEPDRLAESAMLQCLAGLCWLTGDVSQALGHYRRALEVSRAAGATDMEGAALSSLGAVSLERGALERSVDHLTAALAVHRAGGQELFTVDALIDLSLAYLDMGRLAAARDCIDEALRRSRARHVGGAGGRLRGLVALGMILAARGDLDGALGRLEESLAGGQGVASAQDEASAHIGLAVVHRDARRADLAEEHAARGLTLGHHSGNPLAVADALIVQGTLAPPGRAVELHARALRHAAVSGYRRGELTALLGLAGARRARADLDSAADAIDGALRLAQTHGFRRWEAYVLAEAARLHHALGDRARAVRSAETARSIHRETGDDLGERQAGRLLAAWQAGGAPVPAG